MCRCLKSWLMEEQADPDVGILQEFSGPHEQELSWVVEQWVWGDEGPKRRLYSG